MGALDFTMNAIQSGQISELYEKLESQQKEILELKNQIEMLAKWVEFLKEVK